jgi:DNA polymerase I-like protein with 3'-5' exonuclease and polymerase domains
MGPKSLSIRIGQPISQAKELLRQHRERFKIFWKWSDAAVDFASLYGKLWSTFGWTVRITKDFNPRFLRNFPMQSNGAEMLRLACCFAVERGVRLCAPIHDAILIEAPIDQLEEHVIIAQQAMADASAAVLNGFRLRTEAKTIRYPDRYMDKRGVKMWNTVWGIFDEIGFK